MLSLDNKQIEQTNTFLAFAKIKLAIRKETKTMQEDLMRTISVRAS